MHAFGTPSLKGILMQFESRMSRVFITMMLACVASAVHAAPPLVIAHRGGTGDAPENTEYAIQKAIDNGADAIWITLQLSRDNVVVLYRPSDLSALTPLQGAVSAYTADQLRKADAAYHFDPPAYPLRGKGITVPTLQRVLQKWPGTFFFLDLKSPDASPKQFADALSRTLRQAGHESKVRVYSTQSEYLRALPSDIAKFESRDVTRTMLANVTMNHQCIADTSRSLVRWYGFEYEREVQVTERFTLGEASSRAVLRWDKEAVDCFKRDAGSKVVLFGINTIEDYRQATALGADGVLVDSPAMFRSPSSSGTD